MSKTLEKDGRGWLAMLNLVSEEALAADLALVAHLIDLAADELAASLVAARAAAEGGEATTGRGTVRGRARHRVN